MRNSDLFARKLLVENDKWLSLCVHLRKKTAGSLDLGRNRGLHRGFGVRMAWLGLKKY